MAEQKSRLVVIGWPAADWKALHPLMDGGLMPNLLRLVERGVAGNLKPVGQLNQAMQWASLSTGQSADRHGILSGIEPDPLSGGTRSASSTSRRVRAIWNISMQAGARHTWWAGRVLTPPNL